MKQKHRRLVCFVALTAAIWNFFIGPGWAQVIWAQVISDPNQIRGLYEFTNTNPEILQEIDFTRLSVRATSLDHDPVLVSTLQNGVAVSPTARSFELTVEAGDPGIVYELRFTSVQVGSSLTNGPKPITEPVEPAPWQSAEILVQECLGRVNVATVDQDSGEPVDVYRIDPQAYAQPATGNPVRRSLVSERNQGTALLLFPDDGLPVEIEVMVQYRAHPSLSYLTLEQTFPLAGPYCDRTFELTMPVPEDTRPPAESGGVRGRFDLVGEEVHRAQLVTDRNQNLFGPFPTTFEDPDVPVGDLRLHFRNIYSGRGYEYQSSRTRTRFEVPIFGNETTDVGDTFVMIPGRLQADAHFVGPPDAISGGELSCLADLYRDVDDDDDGDGVPNRLDLRFGTVFSVSGSSTIAPGATHPAFGAQNLRTFSGEYEPSLAEHRGEVDLALTHLSNEDALWQRPWVRFNFEDVDTPSEAEGHLDSYLVWRDDLQGETLTRAGEISELRDQRLCFSEVRMHFRSLASTFFDPRLRGSGDFDGPDFGARPAAYEITDVSAYGTPTTQDTAASEGLVRMCLPQGSYELIPTIQAINPDGTTSSQRLEDVVLEVGCRQVLDFRSDLQVTLDPVPRCVPDPSLTLTGSIRGTFGIDSIVAEVDGAPVAGCAESCGENPDYAVPVLLNPCTNSLSVTAVDSEGGVASAATTSSVDTAPPTLTACPDVRVTASPDLPEGDPDGAFVDFGLGATDACDGNVPVICDRPSGSFFPVGETAVACQAFDACGFADACSFRVTVLPLDGEVAPENTVCSEDPFENPELSDAWQLDAMGDAGTAAELLALEQAGGTLRLTGTGSSLYHDPQDHGAFLWRSAEAGDFRAELEIAEPSDPAAQASGGVYRKATLMVRAGSEADAPRIAVSYVPGFPGGAAVMFDVRGADGTARELGSTVPAVDLPVHLAVERRGSRWTVYLSRDGSTWIRPAGALGGSIELELGERPRVGPMVTSYDGAVPVTFDFERFQLCKPNPHVAEPTGTCDDTERDVLFLLDQSGSLARELSDGITQGEATRWILEDAITAIDGDGDHRVALVTASADPVSFERPVVSTWVPLDFTTDGSAARAALGSLPDPDPESPTPLTHGLRRARQLLQDRDDAGRRSVIVWVTDGLSTVDGDGNGPAFYTEEEVRAIPLRRPDGSYLSRGQVAWSGAYHPTLDTFDGEATADVMAEIEGLQADFPDLRILALHTGTVADPGYPELMGYAAELTSGAFVGLETLDQVGAATVELLDAVHCGETAGASVGGLLWHDVDGNGAVDAGEPVIDGARLELDGELTDGSTTTGTVFADIVDGRYGFSDLEPGTYTLTVLPGTLPADLDQPTFDADGVGTPHVVTVSVDHWSVEPALDFGYRGASGPIAGCFVDDFDGSLAQGWSLVGLGAADQVAAQVVDGALHLAGDGMSLYAGPDHGAFLYRPIAGDFVAEVDVTGFPVDEGGPYRKAGLMLRAGLGSEAPRILVQLIPHWNGGSQKALQFRYRASESGPGDGALGSNLFGAALPSRLRVSREGDVFRVAFSYDGGTTWQTPTGGSLGSVQLHWPDTLLLGLSTVSYHADVATTAALDDFRVCAPDAVP